MSKILFINQPAMGHLTTLQSIAARMQADGHTIHFVVPGMRENRANPHLTETIFEIQKILKQNNFPVDIIPPALTTLPAAMLLPYKSGYDEITHLINLFSQGIEHYTRYILKFMETYQPDVIVTDFAFLASSIAAEIKQIPYVVIYAGSLPFRGEGVPPFGSGLSIGTSNPHVVRELEQKEQRALNMFDTRVNIALQRFGLPETAPDILRRPYSPWLNLVTSATASEAPRNNLTPFTFFIGPCIENRAKNQPAFPFEQLLTNRYKIYISLGNAFKHKPDMFRKFMAALDNPVYQVIVSAGEAYPTLEQNPLPKNVLLFNSVPQAELLPKINLFISHGGYNNINEALITGKPLLVMPLGGEQGDNASRVQYLGVGLRLDLHHFSEKQLLEAVEKIRVTPAYEVRASTIRQSLQATDGVQTASHCIAWVARHRKPLVRPENMPLTITPSDLSQLFNE